MLAQLEEELLHLVGEGVRLDQRHAADGRARPAARLGDGLEHVAPPGALLGALGLGDVDRERVPQLRRVQRVREQGEVEERGARDRAVGGDPGLREVQPADAVPDGDAARLDADAAAALAVLVRERAGERGVDVRDAAHQVRPGVRHRVLEVEHHARGARVEHLHHQLGVVGGPGHLVALVGAPRGHVDAPVRGGRGRGRQVVGQRAVRVRGGEALATRGGEPLLAGRELGVQLREESGEARGQVALGAEVRGRGVHARGTRVGHGAPRRHGGLARGRAPCAAPAPGPHDPSRGMLGTLAQ